MGLFIKPNKLCIGDTVATISLSGGRAGDPHNAERYKIGKTRIEEIFGLKVIELPNSMKGHQYLYENPKARANDLTEALLSSEIKGIFLNMGGDDGIRLLPYIDFTVIKDNPKVFLGFSDGDTFHHMFAHAGVTSFYGGNILATFAEPGELNPYTIKWIKKALFSTEPMGQIEPPDKWTPINYEATSGNALTWTLHEGYKVYQGSGKVRGHIMTGCSGPLHLMLGTRLFPSADLWKNSVIFLEAGTPYGMKLAGLHSMRAFAATGMFHQAAALVLPRLPDDVVDEVILKVLKEEGLNDLPVLTGVEFAHSNPMTVLPIGIDVEVDCEYKTVTIVESGVC
jgi:muramoyltetrapeptide carboxypeptidase LdcA involved in peptidoglycan recycling